MFHLGKILVPIDFSANGLIAANHVGALARHFHSEVTLLHVNDFLVLHPLNGPLGFGITSAEAERAEHLSRRQQQLDEFGVAEPRCVPVKRLLRCGDPAKLIVECAREDKSELIFMPTHGHGSFRRYLLGSVTAKVLHDAESPVVDQHSSCRASDAQSDRGSTRNVCGRFRSTKLAQSSVGQRPLLRNSALS